MSKNAPDTRNKLDGNPRTERKKPQIKKKKVTQTELKAAYEKTFVAVETAPAKEKKLTPAEQFRKDHGYSKTMSKLMKKHGVDSPQGYAVSVRRPRKLAEKKVRQKKHADSTAYRRANSKGKTKGKKSNQPAVVKEKKK